jgi:hypothetical protein
VLRYTDIFEEWSGSPSLLDHPMNARHGQMPRQVCHCLALCDGNGPAAFRQPSTLGTWNSTNFRGRLTAARTLAYLRIDVPVTRDAARLASGLLGSALTEWVSHPRDGSPNFESEISSSFPFGQALTGRNLFFWFSFSDTEFIFCWYKITKKTKRNPATRLPLPTSYYPGRKVISTYTRVSIGETTSGESRGRPVLRFDFHCRGLTIHVN